MDRGRMDGFAARLDLHRRELAFVPAAKGVTLVLSEPVEVLGPYGLRRRARTIALGLDDPALLEGLPE